MVDFKIPSILDVPIVEPIIVEPETPVWGHCGKGFGDPRMAFPAPALPTPSYNAVGGGFNENPDQYTVHA